jgi:hypothetical protein
MKEQYTQDQLLQIVAEVEALAKHRDAELDREQVQSILEELRLPPDLLDEAMIQLQRREALAVQQRRNRWIAVGAAVVLGGAIATTAIALHNQQQTFARISAYQDYIGWVGDRNSPLTLVNRQMNPDVEYRVTLQNVPQGQKLDLQCNWLDPNGQTSHQNRYQTRRIDKLAPAGDCLARKTGNGCPFNGMVFNRVAIAVGGLFESPTIARSRFISSGSSHECHPGKTWRTNRSRRTGEILNALFAKISPKNFSKLGVRRLLPKPQS